MSLPRNLFAVAFRTQSLGTMFAAVLAMTVYIATIAVASGVALSQTAGIIERNISSTLTVEIPARKPVENNNAEVRARVLKQLRGMAGVTSAEIVPDGEIAETLRTWVDDRKVLETLPLPTLIDVTIAAGVVADAAALRQSLSVIASDVRVDAHADWMVRLLLILRTLGAISLVIIAIATILLGITVSLSCRAAIAVQRDTVDLLHVMGSSDRDIALLFRQHILRLAWPAALAGFIASLATVGIVAFFIADFLGQSSAILELQFSSNHVWLGVTMLAVPLIAVVGAVGASRILVIRALGKMP